MRNFCTGNQPFRYASEQTKHVSLETKYSLINIRSKEIFQHHRRATKIQTKQAKKYLSKEEGKRAHLPGASGCGSEVLGWPWLPRGDVLNSDLSWELQRCPWHLSAQTARESLGTEGLNGARDSLRLGPYIYLHWEESYSSIFIGDTCNLRKSLT